MLKTNKFRMLFSRKVIKIVKFSELRSLPSCTNKVGSFIRRVYRRSVSNAVMWITHDQPHVKLVFVSFSSVFRSLVV